VALAAFRASGSAEKAASTLANSFFFMTSGTVLIVSFSLTQAQFYVSIEMIKPKK
jgi:hypothetical protein